MDTASYKILSPGDIDQESNDRLVFELDVLNGLSEHPKRLPSKYFYDDEGSRLFQDIMALPEYYLTDCEFQIFESHKQELSRLFQEDPFTLVELGAGDGLKTNILIEQFLKDDCDFKYSPLDISEGAMVTLTDSLRKKFPKLNVNGVVAEYFDGLKWISNISKRRNVILFLGSNIGNFGQSQARVFLRSLWNSLNDGDYLMIGFDLKKDIEVMLRAYNDSKGVTAEFNLNLLNRINRELGGDFDADKFRFYANYDVFSGAIQSYLVSLEAQEVHVGEIGESFKFRPWEPIHTEYSYKFLESEIENLASATGYRIVRQLYDRRRYFVDSIWQVEKQTR